MSEITNSDVESHIFSFFAWVGIIVLNLASRCVQRKEGNEKKERRKTELSLIFIERKKKMFTLISCVMPWQLSFSRRLISDWLVGSVVFSSRLAPRPIKVVALVYSSFDLSLLYRPASRREKGYPSHPFPSMRYPFRVCAFSNAVYIPSDMQHKRFKKKKNFRKCVFFFLLEMRGNEEESSFYFHILPFSPVTGQ